MRHHGLVDLTILMLVLGAAWAPGADVTLTGADLALVPLNGVAARIIQLPAAPDREGVARVEFETTGEVRRMVAVAGVVPAGAEAAGAVTLQGELQLTEGKPPRLGVVLFGRNGERWVRKGTEIQPGPGRHTWALSVQRMQAAAFTETDTGSVVWSAVERVWVGLIFDEPAKGSWDVHAVCFTNDRLPALASAPLLAADASGWELHHDEAVKAELTTREEGPGGAAILRVTYTFSGDKHLFCTCSLPVSVEQPELYRSVRLTYRASFPPGIAGLLFILEEDGGACYVAQPMPPASAHWQTLVLPYTAFELAAWTPDPNARFDPHLLTKVWVGAHGAATGTGGQGCIEIATIELLP